MIIKGMMLMKGASILLQVGLYGITLGIDKKKRAIPCGMTHFHNSYDCEESRT